MMRADEMAVVEGRGSGGDDRIVAEGDDGIVDSGLWIGDSG